MAKNYYIPLMPGSTYHVFNRAVGSEKLFNNYDNYRYFLNKWFEHTGGVLDVYCYTLLPNHFHFLLRIKEEQEVAAYYEVKKKRGCSTGDTPLLSEFVMERISNCLNCYAKAFNKENDRRGALFMDFTRRSAVEEDTHFSKMIHYIHANAVQHGYCKEVGEWPFSSYQSILSGKANRLLQDEVLNWFGTRAGYLDFHQQPATLKKLMEP